MSEWIPNTGEGVGPRYLQIVAALEQDITGGMLPPGTRLLPHRDMAERLGLSVGTVSKAYDEAEKRGLISGEVGRGTFVLGPMTPGKLLDGEDRTRRVAHHVGLRARRDPDDGRDLRHVEGGREE